MMMFNAKLVIILKELSIFYLHIYHNHKFTLLKSYFGDALYMSAIIILKIMFEEALK